MVPPKNSPWSEAAEDKLMLCVLDYTGRVNWRAVATAMGDEFTPNAC